VSSDNPTKQDMVELMQLLDGAISGAIRVNVKHQGCEYVLIAMAPRPDGVAYASVVGSSITDPKHIMVALVHAAVDVKKAIEEGVSWQIYNEKKEG
jgi:hypothetical protein